MIRIMKKNQIKKNAVSMSFVLPALILLFIFVIIPFMLSFYYSFMDYNILKPKAMSFVGLDNFKKVFTDTIFIKSIYNTFRFTIFVVPLQLVSSIGISFIG